MPIFVEWLNEQSCTIVISIVKQWSWEDIFSAIERCHAMMDSVSHPVCTIFDVSQSATWPTNPFKNLQKANEMTHPRSHIVTIVGLPPFYRGFVSVFQKMRGFSNPNGVFFFPKLEEAQLFLKEKHPPPA